jgi:hypothetical protein
MSAFRPILDTLPPLPDIYAGMHQFVAISCLALAVSVVGLVGIAAVLGFLMAQNQRERDRKQGLR